MQPDSSAATLCEEHVLTLTPMVEAKVVVLEDGTVYSTVRTVEHSQGVTTRHREVVLTPDQLARLVSFVETHGQVTVIDRG